MPTANGKLGVGICGVGWCGAQHIQAFQKNPHTEVTWLYGGPDEQRTRASAAKNSVDLPNARIATSYDDLIAAPDVDIVSIASPNAIAMSKPIAHKCVTAGDKVQSMTILDLVMRPEIVQQAWTYFPDLQTKENKYEPMIRPQDQPAICLNKSTMDKYRPEIKKYYYDPTKYKTYLEQLGIKYPMVKK